MNSQLTDAKRRDSQCTVKAAIAFSLSERPEDFSLAGSKYLNLLGELGLR